LDASGSDTLTNSTTSSDSSAGTTQAAEGDGCDGDMTTQNTNTSS
jgi:hypothetical protein